MTHRPFGLADLLKRSRTESILVLGLMVSYAYFSQAGGWNQNSRFDLVRAIVEQGTTRIDAYADNTGDKAVLNGHTYSDKAPGIVWASGMPTLLANSCVRSRMASAAQRRHTRLNCGAMR